MPPPIHLTRRKGPVRERSALQCAWIDDGSVQPMGLVHNENLIDTTVLTNGMDFERLCTVRTVRHRSYIKRSLTHLPIAYDPSFHLISRIYRQ